MNQEQYRNKEEEIIASAEAVINEDGFKNDSLADKFKDLLKAYKKLHKQSQRLIRLNAF